MTHSLLRHHPITHQNAPFSLPSQHLSDEAFSECYNKSHTPNYEAEMRARKATGEHVLGLLCVFFETLFWTFHGFEALLGIFGYQKGPLH